MGTDTSTVATFAWIGEAIASGQWGLAIGGILLMIVGFLRVTRFTALFDSREAVMIAAAVSFVGTFGEELVRSGGAFLAAIGPALSLGLPVLFAAFVPARGSDSDDN